MRGLAVVTLSAACARPPTTAPAAPDPGAPSLVPYTAPTAAGCQLDGNVATVDELDAAAPVVVLDETYIGGDEHFTFAAWADGTVVFDTLDAPEVGRRATTVPPATIEALRRNLDAELTTAAPFAVLGGGAPDGRRWAYTSDAPETSLFVRIRGGWRVAVVYDLSRAALEPGPPNPYHDPPPPYVLRAFRTAVAAIPDHGDPWEPQHYLLELLTDPPRHRGPPQDYGAARPWPADLAVPPPTLQPHACDLITQGTASRARRGRPVARRHAG